MSQVAGEREGARDSCAWQEGKQKNAAPQAGRPGRQAGRQAGRRAGSSTS